MRALRWGAISVLLFMFLAFAAMAEAAGTVTRHIDNIGSYTLYRWTFVEAGGAAVETGETYTITGRIVGVKFVETSITVATTVKLLDAAGRDVLQGLFTTPEASATATASDHYRVPVDSTSGGYIYLFDEAVYIDISSGDGTDSGYVDVIVDTR